MTPVDDFVEKSLEKKVEENRESDILSCNDMSSVIDFLMFWDYVVIYFNSSVVILTIIRNQCTEINVSSAEYFLML